jgi:hypothetical protein
MHRTEQHHIAWGVGFGQDQTNELKHIKMVMSGFITSWHRSWILRP